MNHHPPFTPSSRSSYSREEEQPTSHGALGFPPSLLVEHPFTHLLCLLRVHYFHKEVELKKQPRNLPLCYSNNTPFASLFGSSKTATNPFSLLPNETHTTTYCCRSKNSTQEHQTNTPLPPVHHRNPPPSCSPLPRAKSQENKPVATTPHCCRHLHETVHHHHLPFFFARSKHPRPRCGRLPITTQPYHLLFRPVLIIKQPQNPAATLPQPQKQPVHHHHVETHHLYPTVCS